MGSHREYGQVANDLKAIGNVLNS